MKKQMLYLFISNLSILFVGMGLFPLLPIYAGQFGATPTTIGIYLALVYVSITTGTILTGWLTKRFPRRTVLVAAGTVGVPALVLLGHATSLWQVVLLTGTVWFTGGIGLALISIFTGLYADKASRGKWFSLISLTLPIGAIAGGMMVGRLVEWQGYPFMFACLAGVYAIWPVVGLLKIEDKPLSREAKVQAVSTDRPQLGGMFRMLLLAALLSAMTVSVVRLGVSLSMKNIQFSPAAITGVNVIGGLVTIPVVLSFGSLSDRLGRKRFLALGYFLAAVGGVTLIMADQLWHFWLVSAAMLIARSINGSLASALATDILPPEALDRGLPRLNSMAWIAGIVGFAGSGYIIDTMGSTFLFMIGTLLSVGAASMVWMLPRAGEQDGAKHSLRGLSRLVSIAKVKS